MFHQFIVCLFHEIGYQRCAYANTPIFRRIDFISAWRLHDKRQRQTHANDDRSNARR